MAGLLAARVLADTCEEVTIVGLLATRDGRRVTGARVQRVGGTEGG